MKTKAKIWVILSDTGGDGRFRDAGVDLIRGTRRDAQKYAERLSSIYDEAVDVIGPLVIRSPKQANLMLTEEEQELHKMFPEEDA